MYSLILTLSRFFVIAILISQYYSALWKNYPKASKWTLYYVREIYQPLANKEGLIKRQKHGNVDAFIVTEKRGCNLGLGCFH